MPHIPTDQNAYEVFQQNGAGAALVHVGSIIAPRQDAAWHLAKEAYGRRDDVACLWVVRRADMIVSDAGDHDLLAAKTRMPHRQPGFPTARRRDRSSSPTAAASPSGPDRTRSKRPDDPLGAGEPGLADVWLALADDLFVLGSRLGARIVDYIDLEESLAVGSIGQEALAHAQTILLLCGFDQTAADARFFDREQARWQVSRVIGQLTDWPSTVACGLVLAAAVSVLSEHTMGADPGAAWPAAMTAVRDEQLVHLDHWRRWAQALAAWPETRPEFARAYADVTERAGDMFGALPQAAAPAPRPVPILALHERLAALLDDVGGPESRLSPRPLARTPGLGADVLADCLSRARLVRGTYAPGVFQ